MNLIIRKKVALVEQILVLVSWVVDWDKRPGRDLDDRDLELSDPNSRAGPGS